MSFSQRKWSVNPEEKVTHHPNIDLLLLIYILAFYANSEAEPGAPLKTEAGGCSASRDNIVVSVFLLHE